jgi:hypothetical protein
MTSRAPRTTSWVYVTISTRHDNANQLILYHIPLVDPLSTFTFGARGVNKRKRVVGG